MRPWPKCFARVWSLALLLGVVLLAGCAEKLTYPKVKGYYRRQARRVDKELEKRTRQAERQRPTPPTN